VTLVEMLPQIVPVEDDEVAKVLVGAFRKAGIAQHVGEGRERAGGENLREARSREGRGAADARGRVGALRDRVVAISRAFCHRGESQARPRLRGRRRQLSLERPGIYAAGDIIGPPWLAHVATFEAVNAVNGMFGAARPKRVKNFPGCTYASRRSRARA